VVLSYQNLGCAVKVMTSGVSSRRRDRPGQRDELGGDNLEGKRKWLLEPSIAGAWRR
jgi:hypothetical protein